MLQIGLKCFSMRMTHDLLHEVREHGSFTTACGNPDTLKSMSMSSRCVNKSMDCSLSTGLTVLI